MLGSLDNFRVVAEVTTAKEIVRFLGGELAARPCTVLSWVISWDYVWEAVQVFVDLLDKYPICERTFLVLCLVCGC